MQQPDIGRIGFSEEQAELMDVATAFCRQRSPVSRVRELLGDETGFDAAVWREIGQLGWLGIAIPEVYGGVGLQLGEVVPVVEQMGRRLLSTPFVSTTLTAQAILVGGTEAQKLELLPDIAAGADATLALVESNGDWDLQNITAEAKRAGTDRLVLTGEKLLVCDALVAKWMLVSVRHEGQPALVIIDARNLLEGSLRREVTIDETRRAYSLSLDGLEIAENRLLDPTRATACFDHIHLVANLLGAAEMCGGTQAVIDYTLDYLKTRKQFGQLIGAYQAVKHPIVDAYVLYEQARSHLYSAAHCFAEQGAGEIATRMAKAQADCAFSFAADRAIQFHGGFGFSYDCDAQLYRRRAIWHASQYGDALYHKRKLADLLL